MANQKIKITKQRIYWRRLRDKVRTLALKANQWLEGLGSVSTNKSSTIRIKKESVIGVRLTIPQDGAQVPERPFVEGMVADPRARIWVVVHPMRVGDYWVQPPVTVREDGVWKTQIHIGRPGMIDVGERFEMKAIANPRMRLWEGLVLDWWPEGEGESQVIEVTRI